MADNKSKARFGNRVRNIAFILFCVMIMVVFTALIVMQASSYNSLRAEHSRMTLELERAQAVYRDLRYRKAHFDTDAYIEELARNWLGWVRPDEIVFRKITDGVVPEDILEP